MSNFIKRTAKTRYKIYLGILVFIFVALYAMTYMPGQSYTGSFPKPTPEQLILAQKYKQEVTELASTAHNSTHIPALKEAEKFIEKELRSRGFNDINIQKFGGIEFKNFEVVLNPTKNHLNTLVIGAHYDSAGNAPGADDNASSVVILLELASRFKASFKSEHTKVRIVFFANEEPPFFKSPLMGSVKYAKMLHDNKEPVVAMYAFDALGYFKEESGTQHYPFMFVPFYPTKGNFVGFVGNLSSRDLVVDSLNAFRKDAKFPSEGVSAWEKIPGVDYSDHQSFYKYEWPALMVTDTAFNRNDTYHTPSDSPETLDYIKMTQLTSELEKMFRLMYEK